MQPIQVDVAIIGAGTAGMAAYRSARAAGARTLLIEGSRYGTTCARVGCMPSKLLIAAADAAWHSNHAHHFGVGGTMPVAIDGVAVMARVRRERDRFVGFVEETVESFPEADRLFGHARFVDGKTLMVGEERVDARAIVIATGSVSRIPPVFQAVADRVITNDEVFDWTDLPRSVVVFGAGVIGLELGQALHRLGVRVRILGKDGTIGALSDPLIKEAMRAALASELPFDPDARVLGIERVEEGVAVRFLDGGVEHRETFEWLLAATGRVPNLAGLGLDQAGIALDDKGMPRFDRTTMRIEDSSIFLAGDVNNDVPLLHEAADEGRIAGANAAAVPDVTPGLRRSPLSVVFSDPQIAMVGNRWSDVQGRDPIVGKVSFDDQGRSRVMLQNRGALHVYADRQTGRFLGAEMAGPRAEHIGHLLSWAHQMGLTVGQMLDMPFYHPVVEEGLRTALRDAQQQLKDAASAA
jgi:dihydrolipoamide dehydrogenase